MTKIQGFHHVTAIAGDVTANYEFYTQVLGLRLIKKTVNYDDPQTYHLYFADEQGTPGTVLTFFPWGSAAPRGKKGAGMTTEVGLSVPHGSLEFWVERFKEYNVLYNNPTKRFGYRYMPFLDPDGLKLELVERGDNRIPWTVSDISSDVAIRGISYVTLTLKDKQATEKLLISILGYDLVDQYAHRYLYKSTSDLVNNYIEIVELATEDPGLVMSGTVHHVAFRVQNDEELQHIKQLLEAYGIEVTQVIDRNYFHSIYFREPGGVLFEIATNEPGFLVDESVDTLGTTLQLPPQYESQRSVIESHLAPLG